MNKTSFSKTLSFLCYLWIVPSFISAQPFLKTPNFPKKVKKIVEWTRSDFSEKSLKGNSSFFDRDGRITTYYREETPEKGRRVYQYDPQKRLIKSTEGLNVDREVIKYVYGKNYKTREQHFRNKVYKKVVFLNDKMKALEEKKYIKGNELGNKFILQHRIIFNYNKKDSLIGEMHYSYLLEGRHKGKKNLRRKFVHRYDKKTKKRIKTLEYDFDKSLRVSSSYQYDKKGRPTLFKYNFPKSGQERVVEYKYKADKIWQEIEIFDNKKTVKIYTDGRLIRLRTYQDDKIFNIIDYQYIYY